MIDPIFWMIMAAAGLIGLAIAAHAALKGWNGWLALRHAELDRHHAAATPPGPAARIELADLRERVRKLEAIAAGVDL
ncbi:hypothetical protein [Sphingomonas profundi]|uniref:hypothetical protein n=1 Tax=Alterirhizorhabdus profundi TaxID=2681549 RepID=UPI0012E7BF7E|nr:hypothetical protein [Sphingomonas profundi]